MLKCPQTRGQQHYNMIFIHSDVILRAITVITSFKAIAALDCNYCLCFYN